MIGRWCSLSWRGRLSSLSVPLLLLSGTDAPAQEGLRTALAGDRSARARQVDAVDDARPHAGPVEFEFSVGLSYSGEFNDNITISEVDRESDFIHRPQVNLNGFLPTTETGRLSLGFGIGYTKYSSHEELNSLYFSPDSQLAYDIVGNDFVLSFYDGLEYSQDVESVAALSGVARFPRLENTIGTRISWAPSRWTYQAGYAHYNFISAENEFSYLDRSSEQFFARVGYGFAPATQVGLETSVALTDYITGSTQPDNNNFSVGPYTEWHVTEALIVSARGGFTYFAFDSIPASFGSRPISPGSPSFNLSTYYAGLGISHNLTEFISHDFSCSHDVRPAISSGSSYLESTQARYSASWSLTQNTTVGMNFVYERGKESAGGAVAVTTEAYERFGAGLSASRKLSGRLTAAIAYNYLRRNSTAGGGDYYQNRTSISLQYQF